jgi:hypothetical protein
MRFVSQAERERKRKRLKVLAQVRDIQVKIINFWRQGSQALGSMTLLRICEFKT